MVKIFAKSGHAGYSIAWKCTSRDTYDCFFDQSFACYCLNLLNSRHLRAENTHRWGKYQANKFGLNCFTTSIQITKYLPRWSVPVLLNWRPSVLCSPNGECSLIRGIVFSWSSFQSEWPYWAIFERSWWQIFYKN